jgi:glutathione-specific gamma-glutamylcyclotransferase
LRKADPTDTRRVPPALPKGDLWVFGYGSLMWNPGFEHVRSAPALLRGYHRAFCIHSRHYRGTPEQPGLVLGLARGGACRGVAFLVAARKVNAVLAQLWDREMSGYDYRVRLVTIEVESRRRSALAFIADPAGESYAGRLELGHIAATIAKCRGAHGANVEYLENTLRHLDEMGLREGKLHAILRTVQTLGRRSERSEPKEGRLRRGT